MGEVNTILNGEKQIHTTRSVSLPNCDIVIEQVSFGYHEGAEILHDVSLNVRLSFKVQQREKRRTSQGPVLEWS